MSVYPTASLTSERPEASLVLPTHGRREALLRVLRALARQTAPPESFEVVVVCDGDVDGTVAACASLAPELPYALRVIEQQNGGPATARNRGVAAARGELIVFFDDDQLPHEDLIAAHLEAHREAPSCVTVGEVLPPPDARLNLWGAWEERGLCRQYEAMQEGRYLPTWRQFFTGNAAVRRAHILAAGGFNTSLRRAEDIEMAWRLHLLGLRFVFLPRAKGWHYSWRGFAAWLRIPRAYGEVEVAIARANSLTILGVVAKEFPTRNRVIRALTLRCAGRPALLRAVVWALGLLARVADWLRWERLGFPLCSLIYNLCYYDGIADALGGRHVFLRLLQPGVGQRLLDAEAPRTLDALFRPTR